MKRQAYFAAISFILSVFAATVPAAEVSVIPTAPQGSLQAVFSPWEDIEGRVVEVIGNARRQILVQAYLLTSKSIATTLVAAHRRGVDVRVLVDAAQVEKVPSSMASELVSAGVDVSLETKYQNAHNKVIVVDAGTPEATVITGSFNFTWTAQHKNAENILIARHHPALAARYAQNWERHRQDATPYKK